MALANFFKRTPKKDIPQSKGSVPHAATESAPPVNKRERRFIGVILAPHLTEKTSRGSATGWYGFRVEPHANKHSVKRAVEERYGVHVLRVRILNQGPRRVRIGKTSGEVPGFRKALVALAAGESITITS